MKEEMKDTMDVLLKLDIDADDFYCITIYKNEIWLQGFQSEKNLERYPNAIAKTNRVDGYLYKEWIIGNVSIQVILSPII
jgi:hypothetical protein